MHFRNAWGTQGNSAGASGALVNPEKWREPATDTSGAGASPLRRSGEKGVWGTYPPPGRGEDPRRHGHQRRKNQRRGERTSPVDAGVAGGHVEERKGGRPNTTKGAELLLQSAPSTIEWLGRTAQVWDDTLRRYPPVKLPRRLDQRESSASWDQRRG